MPLLTVGTTAPNFSLLNQSNSLITLDQFKGKWVVIYFYPKAMTPGCTVQACGLRDQRQTYDREDAVILGISPDKPAALQKFIAAQGLNFMLLSDADHKTAEAYGTWQEKSMYGKTYMGMARVTYVIDPKGEIAHVMPKVDTKSHADDIINIIKGLKYDR